MHWSKNDWQWMQNNTPVLTVDGVVVNEKEKVLMTKREIEPFKGYWHLPGGHVNYGEKVEEAVVRVMKEETGIKSEIVVLIGVYSSLERDPRGHFVTVAFLMKPMGGDFKSDFQAGEVKYFDDLPKKIGFDAKEIANDGLKLWKRLKKNKLPL